MYANDLLLCMRMNKSGSIDVFLLFWCVGVFGCVFGGKWTIDQLCRGMTRVVDFVMETTAWGCKCIFLVFPIPPFIIIITLVYILCRDPWSSLKMAADIYLPPISGLSSVGCTKAKRLPFTMG